MARDEDILQATIDGEQYDRPAESRIEALLIELNELILAGGGGGGGTSNYEALLNKPKINNTTIQGNKQFSDYGLKEITTAELNAMWNN